MRRISVLVAAFCLQAAAVFGQAATPRPMDHDIYDTWNRISDQALSDDGQWLLYSLVPQEGDAVLHVRSVTGSIDHVIPRGRSAEFSGDGGYVVFLIKPELALEREAKKAKKKPDEQPKDSLGILDLSSGDIVRLERVKSFAVPEDSGAWVAYLLEKAREAPKDSADTAAAKPEGEGAPAVGGPPAGQQQGAGEQSADAKKKKERTDGTTLVLRNLATGAESRFDYVTEYAFTKDGARLAFATSTKDAKGDGVHVVATGDGAAQAVLEGEGNYKSVAFDESGTQLAFLTNHDDYQSDQPSFALYYWKAGQEAHALAIQGTAGVPEGWWVSEHVKPSFSDNGQRLFFGTAPRPEPEPDEELPEWEAVKLDVWNWKDPLLQPMQLVQRSDELKRGYEAVVHLKSRRIVQLADEGLPEVEVSQKGNGRLAFGMSDVPYRQEISWESPGYDDVYVVDVENGSRTMLLERLQGRAALSPGGKYVAWWDGNTRAFFAMPATGGNAVNISAGVPVALDDETHDTPMIPPPYGFAGWTSDDAELLIYDRNDIWAVDAAGKRAPRNVTEGVGSERGLRFRYVQLDREEESIPVDRPMLLSAFDRTTKASGFYRDRVTGSDRPQELLMQAARFGSQYGSRMLKADDADVVLFTRESFREFPDLWVADLSFDDMRRVSEANPQMAEYGWGTAELVHWRSSDGEPLDGILYKPDGFDPSKQYPMMVYFYETMSDNLYGFQQPGPGGSSVSVSFYVSRGYVVFIPDIHYRIGHPGESALDCVVPGVLSVLAMGFVDPQRIGVQGHSWGGYQIAYLVTQTNIFRAAEAGAPVSNMTSAYGGIRWGTGMSRMFQYERTQSRIGATLWEAEPLYIENSPLFRANKIETPVLMLHNDDDSAVPWYQGIEFFVALRRLGKPVWLLNYNGEPHGLTKYQNRKDFAIRMQQFFDHYLTGAPEPLWMAEGVPAVLKGKTLGLDLVEPGAVASGGGR
jgi:dipeptidyl aminopeptidase/acylaminoacyl peptidase